jgi:hypothetical protein
MHIHEHSNRALLACFFLHLPRWHCQELNLLQLTTACACDSLCIHPSVIALYLHFVLLSVHISTSDPSCIYCLDEMRCKDWHFLVAAAITAQQLNDWHFLVVKLEPGLNWNVVSVIRFKLPRVLITDAYSNWHKICCYSFCNSCIHVLISEHQ